MMIKLKQKLFIAMVALALFMPLGFRVCDAVVPGVDMASNSDLEGRKYQTKPELTIEAIRSGKLQNAMEQMVADSVPKRRSVLMTHAALQRASIEIANAPFNFEVYPTFYGSDSLYSPRFKAVMERPQIKPAVQQADEQWTSVVAEFMSAHNNIRWAFYLPQRSGYSSVSPANALMNNEADYSCYLDLLESKLPDECAVIADTYESTDEYYRHYFRTDHHWQIQGGVRAYRKICDNWGLKPAELGDFYTAYNGKFYGSNARAGRLADASDTVDDVTYDTSKLSVWINGTSKPLSALDMQYGDKPVTKEQKYQNMYASYFHGDCGGITIKNPTANKRTLLIIGDSYTNNIERLFAANYQTVYVLDPRYFKDNISDFITENKIDDGLFLLGQYTANSTLNKFLHD